ncbi:WhiB family transcriptional regulator [Nocardia terpenica]|nr:WhiB family transcriptional regulator [Nocardia terpenica]MBF6104830.1 WhiB family transcriptional regulator [Nocardia terpenica]MBF6112734.1 WhiB family transcriptional regulator [Nocardia terpenica]MBF6118558.1 WhiB family transcriptional regulator [Nocardia terpenica]MBF6155037.1 WhiB family transcriptional regulator [Nocardia terpenica]
MSWRMLAKCAGDDPARYEVENLPPGREHETANALCQGCPVRTQCLREALTPINVSRTLGLHDRRDVIQQTGVVRGGIPLGLPGIRNTVRPYPVELGCTLAPADESGVPLECLGCHRPMRRRGDASRPGTVLEDARGRCGTCYRKHRFRCGATVRSEHTHCTRCSREFDSPGRHGGLVRIGRASTGTCRSCLWLERDARRRERLRRS